MVRPGREGIVHSLRVMASSKNLREHCHKLNATISSAIKSVPPLLCELCALRPGHCPPRDSATTEVAKSLCSLLINLQHLHTLSLSCYGYDKAEIVHVVRQAPATLPTVRTLHIGTFVEWIIVMCPNVESVVCSGIEWTYEDSRFRNGDLRKRAAMAAVNALAFAKKVEHLEVSFTPTMLSVLPDKASGLRSLGMLHLAVDEFTSVSPDLQKFELLETLMLDKDEDVCVLEGCDSCRSYRHPYAPPDRLYDIEMRRVAYVENAQRIACEVVGLREIWLGHETRGSIKRTSTGSFEGLQWTHERGKAYWSS